MRSREGLVLVEGLRAVQEVLDAGAEVRFGLLSPSLLESPRGRALRQRLEEAGAQIDVVDEEVLERVSDTETPQGAVLVCPEPSASLEDVLAEAGGRILILDAVQDPGNVGTLIRAARAFALTGVIALDGTADPWNPKTVRASAGHAFGIPVLKASWQEVRSALEHRGIPLLVAEAAGTDVAACDRAAPWALTVGNEGAGPRDEVLAAAAERVKVPMPGGTESLNAGVAGSVLLYALSRGSDR